MKDIKNIIEVLAAIEAVGVPVKAALKDGIDASDLPKLLDIIKKYQVVLDAIDNAAEVVEEAKNIDAIEAAQIASKVMEIIKKIKEA